jgi:hypothetical protein
VKGKKAHFVLGWCGLATTDEGHNTTDSLFKVLYEMDAVELSIEDIAGHLERLATAHFVNRKPLDKRGLVRHGRMAAIGAIRHKAKVGRVHSTPTANRPPVSQSSKSQWTEARGSIWGSNLSMNDNVEQE